MDRKLAVTVLVFVVIFSLLQFSAPEIISFDSYYHITFADQMRQNGIIHEFPWLSESILADNFADIQLLFHILLIPFTFVGIVTGGKIAAIFFSTLAFVVFYWFLEKNKVPYPLFFSLLYLFAASSLLYRFLFIRVLSIALVFLFLTLYFLEKKKYLWLGITSLLYVWLYSGFVIQLFVIGAYVVYHTVVTKKLDSKLIAYPLIGALLGLVINPYFPASLSLLYSQIFEINLTNNLYNVEWQPWPFGEFIVNNVVVLFSLAAVAFMALAKKSINRETFFYIVISIFFFTYTIFTRRMHEYLVPFTIISLALVAKEYLPSIAKKKIVVAMSGIILIAGFFAVSGVMVTIEGNTFLYNFDQCTAWMTNNVPENSKILNNAYAFPYLFSQNQHLIYSHGLDFGYSALHNQEKLDRYIGILLGEFRSEEDYLISDYQPDYVFISTLPQDRQLFLYINAHQQNYRIAYQDEWCGVLEVLG